MSQKQSSLFSKLISPFSNDEFWETYFESEPFFTDKSKLNIDFSIEEFEKLLWAHKFNNSQDIQVNKDGKAYFFNKTLAGKDHFSWLMDRYHEGCTLIFNGIDKLVPEIALIARELDGIFKGNTTVNAFLTPAVSKGFLPHFDTHDVFIYQTEGSKEWKLFETETELPLDRQIYLINQEEIGTPSMESTLEKRSVLYIPRGLVHGSYATSSHSLHLTIGVRPLLADEYIKTCIDVLSEQDAELRQSILGKDSKQLGAVLRKLSKLIESKSESIYFNKLVDEKVQLKNISNSRPIPGNRLKNYNQIGSLLPETLVRNIYMGNDLLVDHADKLRLFFPGIGISDSEDVQQGYLEMSATAYGAIRFIREAKESFSSNDFPEIYPMETRIMLLKTLLKNGYLEFV